MAQFKRDYEFGLQKQRELYPLFCDYFKDDLVNTDNVFAPFDYEGTTTSYELKSRRNKYNDYSTTYLPGDKVKPNHPKKQTFLFHFTDGTYYIHYNKELFETFDNNPFRRYREGVRDVKKPYLNIPIKKLVKI